MGLSKAASIQLIKKLASPNIGARLEALNEIDKVLLEKAHTTGEARRYFKHGGINDTKGEGMRLITPTHDAYDDLVHEKPSVKYFIQPDPERELFSEKPFAIAVGPDANASFQTFAGQRYVVSFERLVTNPVVKDVNELYVYPYDIVSFFENWQLKTLMDKESVMFFSLINHLMSKGRDYLAHKNILTANKDTFSVMSFSLLKDKHKSKEVPFSRLISSFELLNEKERTLAGEIENVAYEGITGNTEYDKKFWGMTPLVLHNKNYVYYSFDKANEDLEDEKKQFFIDLGELPATAAEGIDAIQADAGDRAACEYVKNRMEACGYKFTAPSQPYIDANYGAGGTWNFVQWLDANNYLPKIPISKVETFNTDKEVVSLLGKKFVRSIVLTPRAYFGHFDLFNEDARTYLEKENKKLIFHTEEEMIMTARNPRAATALDTWEQ